MARKTNHDSWNIVEGLHLYLYYGPDEGLDDFKGFDDFEQSYRLCFWLFDVSWWISDSYFSNQVFVVHIAKKLEVTEIKTMNGIIFEVKLKVFYFAFGICQHDSK